MTRVSAYTRSDPRTGRRVSVDEHARSGGPAGAARPPVDSASVRAAADLGDGVDWEAEPAFEDLSKYVPSTDPHHIAPPGPEDHLDSVAGFRPERAEEQLGLVTRPHFRIEEETEPQRTPHGTYKFVPTGVRRFIALCRDHVDTRLPRKYSGHKVCVTTASAEETAAVEEAFRDLVEAYGLGAKAATANLFHPENHRRSNKGYTIYFPRRATLDRDMAVVAQRAQGLGTDVTGLPQGNQGLDEGTRLGPALWHRFEFDHDPGYDVDPAEYRRLYRPTGRR